MQGRFALDFRKTFPGAPPPWIIFDQRSTIADLLAPFHCSVCAAPAVGSVAPDFTLPSNTGKDIGLKDLLKKAKHTVLYFYPGKATAVVKLVAVTPINVHGRCWPWECERRAVEDTELGVVHLPCCCLAAGLLCCALPAALSAKRRVVTYLHTGRTDAAVWTLTEDLEQVFLLMYAYMYAARFPVRAVFFEAMRRWFPAAEGPRQLPPSMLYACTYQSQPLLLSRR